MALWVRQLEDLAEFHTAAVAVIWRGGTASIGRIGWNGSETRMGISNVNGQFPPFAFKGLSLTKAPSDLRTMYQALITFLFSTLLRLNTNSYLLWESTL